GHLLAVHLEHTGATAGETAHVVEGQRADAEPVVFEVELEHVLAGGESVGSFPARALEVEKVVQEYGLAFQHVKAVAAEPAGPGSRSCLRRRPAGCRSPP